MVSYSSYVSCYHGGAISFEEWPSYVSRAAEHLNRYKRIYTVTDPMADLDNDEYANTIGGEGMAICAMAEALYNFDLIANGEGGAVQSASIGSVSVSYGSAGTQAVDVTPAGQERELYRCACRYLEIYRGCG